MPDLSQPAALDFRDVFFRWTRVHTIGAIVASVAFVVTLLFQIAFLSGWHLPLADSKIPLEAKNSSVTVSKGGEALAYSFVGPPAVSATSAINVHTDAVLGVTLDFDRIPEQTTLTLGWVGFRDRRKPTNLAIKLIPSATPQTIYVPLRGHSEWRDSATQFAVVLVARPGAPTITLSNVEFVSATPSGALAHAWQRWFGASAFAKSTTVAERTVPLAALVAIAGLLAFGFIAWRRRDDGVARRDGIVGALVALIVLSAALSGFAYRAFRVDEAAAVWLLASAAIAVALFASRLSMPKRVSRLYGVEIMTLALATASVVLGGWPFSWVVFAVIVALIAQHLPSAFARAQPILFFAPVIAIGAFAQAAYAKRIDIAGTSLRDPSIVLANLIEQSGATAAIAAVLLLATFFLNRSQRIARNDSVGIVLWLVVLGIIATLVVSPAQRSFDYSAGAAWILLPILIATIAWLLPSFLAPVTSSVASDSANAKTEQDLSQIVRQLFDGASASFDAAINSSRLASALAPLNRMREIAPMSFITKTAELNYALRGTNLDQARDAYETLKHVPAGTLSSAAQSFVLAYANRINDYDEVVARANAQPPNEDAARLSARAQLLRATPNDTETARLAAIETLRACPKPNNLAHEIAELHLLNDEWQAAQAALAESSIEPQSLPGQVYVARLGFVASGHAAQYVEQIQKLATWNGTLGVAQGAMGETLLAEGNLIGARARFKLAHEADLTLWAFERRVKDVDLQLEASKANKSEA
jgi:hypothetical protein